METTSGSSKTPARRAPRGRVLGARAARLLVLGAGLALAITSLQPAPARAVSSGPVRSAKAATSGNPRMFTILDVADRPIARPSARPRIVSLAPALTEILYAIGAGGDLVADSDYCDYPAAASKLPHVGELRTLRLERIVALRPTLVVTAAGPRAIYMSVEHLTRAPVFVAEDGSVAAIVHNTEALGLLTGHQAQAQALIKRIRSHLAAVSDRASHEPHPTVFYMVWNDPLQTASPRSYLGELIADAGGQNIAPVGPGFYPWMSWETLLVDKPEVVIGPANLASAIRAAGKELGARTAVLDDDIISRPGPRVVEAIDLLYRAIHGESPEPRKP